MKYMSDWMQQDKNNRDLKAQYANKKLGTLKYHIIMLLTEYPVAMRQLFMLALACATLYLIDASIVAILLGIIGVVVILLKSTDWI